MTSKAPRLRLVEPISALSTGGVTVTAQGINFKGPPHIMFIHLFIPFANKTERLPAQFVNESQLTFVIPDVSGIAKCNIVDAWVCPILGM